jgi:hypothetical protein
VTPCLGAPSLWMRRRCRREAGCRPSGPAVLPGRSWCRLLRAPALPQPWAAAQTSQQRLASQTDALRPGPAIAIGSGRRCRRKPSDRDECTVSRQHHARTASASTGARSAVTNTRRAIGACSELRAAPTKACTTTASPDKSVNQGQLPRQKRGRHRQPRQEREEDTADPTEPCDSGRAPIEAGVNWLWGTEPR